MSYQVLARKWRPQKFTELVGQRHVLQALVNALDQQRLHHAYLFTGTRGVGKTTLARLFAKGLNCETGITAEPCGECSACREISENRFVDLIEVDAASRTKVEDTRDLLDNVPYAPARGRYKVYLIDEVHMLSNSSFNALLKTLEEPPEHVKFLLATTDPQRLPMTVLSRCLQFNLKSMTPELIRDHLADILTRENIPFDPDALRHLGRSANGSMRDALSLTDQALAFGSGVIRETEVVTLLGTIDTRQVLSLLEALLGGNLEAILELTASLNEYTPDWRQLMAEILDLLHQIALCQYAEDYRPPIAPESVRSFAAESAPEDVQLYYQLGLKAWQDLSDAPDARQAFEMALLRMLAFTTQPGSGSGGREVGARPAPTGKDTVPGRTGQPVAGGQAAAGAVENGDVISTETVATTEPDMPAPVDEPAVEAGSELVPEDPESAPEHVSEDPEPAPEQLPETPESAPEPEQAGASEQAWSEATRQALDRARADRAVVPDVWLDLLPALELSGAMGNMVQHANATGIDAGGCLQLRIESAYQTLYQSQFTEHLVESLQAQGIPVQSVDCDFGDLTTESAHGRARREYREALETTRAALEEEPLVRSVMADFGGEWVPGSITPAANRTGDGNHV